LSADLDAKAKAASEKWSGARRHFTARPACFSAAGSEATIMTVIAMAIISMANRIEPGNMSGTIGTPVMTRAKGANAGQTSPLYRPARESMNALPPAASAARDLETHQSSCGRSH
jgi:hypothetical protein